MFDVAILYIIFNMTTSNISKMSKYNKKQENIVATAFKKTYSREQCYCSGTAIFFDKVNVILSLGCNNGKKLKVALKFISAKVTFN